MRVCLIFTLILFQIQIVVQGIHIAGVFEHNYPTARKVVDELFESYVKGNFPGLDVTYIPIMLEDGMSEQEVCSRVIASNATIVIDTTRLHGGMSGEAAKLLKRVLRKMKIPTVSATNGNPDDNVEWENLSENEKEYLVQISAPAYSITQIVRDIAAAQSMSTTGVLLDESIAMTQKSLSLLQNIPTRATILKVQANRQRMQEQISKMKTSDISYYFVVGSTETINVALEVAESQNMTDRKYVWFLISTDSTIPRCNCKKLTALWALPSINESEKKKAESLAKNFAGEPEIEVAFYYDLVLMVLKAIENETENWPKQIFYPPCTSDTNPEERTNIQLLTVLNQIGYEGLYGKFVIQKNEESFQEIQMILRSISFVNNIITEPKRIGTWKYHPKNGVFLFSNEKSLDEFRARTIYRVTTIEIPPFIYKNVDKNGTVFFTGYCIDLLNDIKEIVNFEYTIYETEDQKFGTMNDKMEWDGMIRELVDKKAEIALGPISVMAERETVVDFTVPYYDLVGISILMKKPVMESSLFKFLTVLEGNVWACILAAYFVTSILMFAFDRLSPYSYYNNKEKYKDDDEDEKRDFSLKESLWFCMTSLTPQGGGEAPRNLSGRLVAATWWLFGFIIIASYTANLAAFLTVSRLDSPIESLDDLAKQYKIKYAPQDSTSAATYFERMAYIEDKFYEIWKNMSLDDSLNETERAKLAVWDYPVSDKYTKIWWTMKETGMPNSFEQGVQKVLDSKGPQEGFAFIADSTQVKYAVMTHCELTSIGSEFSRKPLALAVQQGSPLKDLISSAILNLLNQRKLEGLKERWWNKNPAKAQCDDTDQQSDGISIENIGGVFIVIAIGVVLAVATLLIEYILFRKKKHKNTRVVTVDKYPDEKHRRR